MFTISNFILSRLKRYISLLTKKPRFIENTIIWGDSELNKSIENVIKKNLSLGFCLVEHIRTGNPRPITFEEIISICDKYKARVLICEDNKITSSIKKKFQKYRIKVFQSEDFYQLITARFPIIKVNDKNLEIGFLTKETKAYEFVSRMLGFLGFLITLPLYPFIIIAIKLDSKGSIFFIQQRLGKNGKPFNFRKFRTMTDDPKRKELDIDWMQTAVPEKERSDITTAGKFLRKYKLDEIPQFINVLKGDICFVGPRPEQPRAFNDRRKMVPHYEKRLDINPGITGWAQIHSSCTAVEKLEYDLFYIKHRSWFLDLLIILKTVTKILSKIFPFGDEDE